MKKIKKKLAVITERARTNDIVSSLASLSPLPSQPSLCAGLVLSFRHLLPRIRGWRDSQDLLVPDVLKQRPRDRFLLAPRGSSGSGFLSREATGL